MSTHQRHWGAQIGAVAMGSFITMQSRANGELAHRMNNGPEAALFSFSVGLVLMTVIAAVSPAARRGVRAALNAVRSGGLKWYQLIGGTGGALFVAIQSHVVPLIGVAIFTIAIVGGQMAASLLVDHWGISPNGLIRLSNRRVIAAALGAVAVVISVSDRFGTAGFSVIAIVLAFVAGAATSFQHAVNGRITVTAGSALSASVFNFVIGTSVLALFFALESLRGATVSPIPSGPLWMYSGGVVGVGFVIAAATVIQKLGSLRTVLGSVAGQLLGSLAIDIALPSDGSRISAPLLIGVGITAFAVAYANTIPRRRAA